MADIEVPSNVKEIVKYIKKPSDEGADKSLYEHVSGIIEKSLTIRPKDAVNLFRFGKDEHAEPDDVKERKLASAETEMKLFDQLAEETVDAAEREEDFELPFSNCYQMSNLFEKAGVGLGREEMFRVFLALKQLALECTFVNVRFWGKMFGIQSDYYIAETEYRDGEGEEQDEDSEDKVEVQQREIYVVLNADQDGPMEDDYLPRSTWKEPLPIKPERHHDGANRNVYFICNHLGESWIRLPHVTPAEIVTSRRITRILTGKLDSPVESYPPFQGTEANYLRALIARISSGTQISPTGYYMLDNEEEEDDEEAHNLCQINLDFEGLSPLQLADGTMANWVHSKQYILPQGRCTWFNPSKVILNDFEEEEDDEDDDAGNLLAETGPQLLSSAANDEKVQNFPAWSSFLSSKILPKYAVAYVRSNRWPGAYTFSDGKIFDNIYIGWGRKYTFSCYNPEFPPSAFEEYSNRVEVTEVDDPTLEQEMAFRQLEEDANNSADEVDNMEEDDEDEEYIQ